MAHQHHGVSLPIVEHQLEEVELPKAEENVSLIIPQFSCDSCCSFSDQQHGISDSKQRSESTAKLCGLMVFYSIVMAVEIIGGLKSNSLAVLADAAHLLTDIAGFSISLFTVWASGWDATSQQSFGFNRIEVLGAFVSVQLIWMISGYLIFEALNRILQKRAEVNGELMFGIAAFGFVINFIMVMWLGHGHAHGHGHARGHGHAHDHVYAFDHNHDHEHGCGHSHDACLEKDHDHGKEEQLAEEENTNLVSTSKDKGRKMNINVEGAYLHVIADMIQSVGVMIAGLVIWAKPEWLMVDLVSTLVFSVLALGTTIPMLRSIFSILMESTPSEVDVVRLETDVENIEGVVDVHDLHVWAITVGKFALACHVKVDSSAKPNVILRKVRDTCETTYGINHITVQIEQV